MQLNQITVPTLDVDRSIEFYKKLGFELIVHTHSDYARFLIPDDDTTFSVSRVEELPKGNGVHVYFEVEDVVASVRELKNKGVEFDVEPEPKTWLWTEAHLKDPDGNHLIIYNAGKNRINPPWRKKN